MDEMDEREEELESLKAIYPELAVDYADDKFTADLELAVSPSKLLYIRFVPITNTSTNGDGNYAQAVRATAPYIERDIQFAHLPPLHLRVMLPAKYPADAPPVVRLTSQSGWLPQRRLDELELESIKLWEEYGHCQILFAYIDFLQQAAERGFDLEQTEDTGCLVLPVTAEKDLVNFDAATTLDIFNSGTYDCGICLEPKKGHSCFQLARCGHIFCKQCLQDFYNNAITEGDIAGVRCLSPDCGKDEQDGRRRNLRKEHNLQPRDLFAIGIDENMIRRYVELKRKKKLEADKTTVYCPRTWCQGAAKSPKYPPIPADLFNYEIPEGQSGGESEDEEPAAIRGQSASNREIIVPANPADRLRVCEKCDLAFCMVCSMGWHGPLKTCFPRNPNDLSAEEKASYDYIRMNTSPCPTCASPTQKTMGCNHMACFQCGSHFCYLCGSWLDPRDPYVHYNRGGTDCYQRLWEMEEGDDGQGPADGRGFVGARRWEQMAIEIAREADEREAEEAARAAQEEEDRRLPGRDAAAGGLQEPLAGAVAVNALNGHLDVNDEQAVEAALANMQVNEQAHAAQQAPQAAGRQRRQRNPFPRAAPAPAERGHAIRNHERNRGPAIRGGVVGLNANVHGRRRDPNRGIQDDLLDDEDD